jgi:hypothetical protein
MKKRPLKKSKKTARKSNVKSKPRPKPRKVSKKGASKTRSAKKQASKIRAPKAVGVVTHFFTAISVAIVRFNKKIPAGTTLHYKGATTDFAEVAKSMQYDHKEIKVAPKGKQVGIKVKKRVREDDKVYAAD